MKTLINKIPRSLHYYTFVILSLGIVSLIITSLAIEDWVEGHNWSGSLYKCTSGEYENQQYFSIYCSSSDCIFWDLGRAGVVYTIFSVLSLVFLLAWVFYSVNQLVTYSRSELWLKLFLSLGSTCTYLFGVLLWAGLSGFLSSESQEEQWLLGPKLAILSALLYLVLSALYFIISSPVPVTISQEEKIEEKIGETPSKLSEDIPDMHSIRIEGRFRYPNSVEYEATDNIPIA